MRATQALGLRSGACGTRWDYQARSHQQET